MLKRGLPDVDYDAFFESLSELLNKLNKFETAVGKTKDSNVVSRINSRLEIFLKKPEVEGTIRQTARYVIEKPQVAETGFKAYEDSIRIFEEVGLLDEANSEKSELQSERKRLQNLQKRRELSFRMKDLLSRLGPGRDAWSAAVDSVNQPKVVEVVNNDSRTLLDRTKRRQVSEEKENSLAWTKPEHLKLA